MRETGPYRRLPLRRWPAALLDSRKRVAIDLRGVPGLFHAPPGWAVPQTKLEENLLYFVVTGSFDAWVGDERLRMAGGSVLWVAAGETGRFQRRDDEPLALLRFRLSLTDANVAYRPKRSWIHRASLREVRPWFEQVILESHRDDSHRDARLRGLLACLVVDLLRHARSTTHAPRLTADQCRALEAHLAQRMTDWPDLAELAEVVDLSPDYFSRLFQRTYGMNVRQWLVERRIGAARLYLAESERSIGDVAAALGYNDVFYFSRQFKQVTGRSPSAYRASIGR